MKFQNWRKFTDRNALEDLHNSGVYIIALSHSNLSSKPFEMIKDVIYVGTTTRDVYRRLRAFNKAIQKLPNALHGGADRIAYKYNYEDIIDRLYVSVKTFPSSGNDEVLNLRAKGNAVKLEFDMFADYLQLYGELPEFNDKKRSSKAKHKIKGRY